MELGSQIKKYRGEKQLSQEQLAEKIYVSRQTISSWENGKSYPDIHSLLLLSNVFEISLDQLIKGDIEIMKNEISKEDISEFNRSSRIFTAMIFIMLLSFIPLVYFLKAAGYAVWGVIALATVAYAFKVEKFKKRHNLRTYREIVSFTEGRTLDEIETAREDGKAPYQRVLCVLAGAAAGGIVAAICFMLLK